MRRKKTLTALLAAGALALGTAAVLAGPQAASAEPERTPYDAILEQASDADLSTLYRENADGSVVALPDSDYTSEDSPLKTGGSVSALAAFPETFDLRKATFGGKTGSFVTPVKFQNPFGACWTFGSMAAAETSFLSENGATYQDSISDAHPKGLDFSEKQLGWFSYMPFGENAPLNQANEGIHTAVDPEENSAGIYNNGGFIEFATSLFSMGTGPIDESYDPLLGYHNAANEYRTRPDGDQEASPAGDWSVPENLRSIANAELEASHYLPSPASWEPTDIPGQQQYKLNQAGVDAIKEQLQAGRGVGICFFADTSTPDQDTPSRFIDTANWAHYTYEHKNEGKGSDVEMNHAVCIVGWDDTYPASNFIDGHEPPGDGAWIVKNSWGSVDSALPNRHTWGIDGSGYFYLSYYDKSITMPEAFDFVTSHDDDLVYGADEDRHEVAYYRYSLLPGSPTSIVSDAPVSEANVYTMQQDCVVRTVSIQTKSFDTTVRYDIYKLKDGATEPTDGRLVWSAERTYANGGLHRVEIDPQLTVKAGDRLGVVVTTQLPSGAYETVQNAYNSEFFTKEVAVPKECPNPQAVWGVATVNEGESFRGTPATIGEDGTGASYADYTWTDLVDEKHDDEQFWEENGFQRLYDARDAAFYKWVELIQKDPTDMSAFPAYVEATNALLNAVNANQGNLLYKVKAVDNFPITLSTTTAEAEPVGMTRLYNPNDGDHFYTTDAKEVAALVKLGWKDEGTKWTTPSTSATPVYRLYNPYTHEHLYTSDTNEIDTNVGNGWRYEGLKFYSDDARTTPVTRLYNPKGTGLDSHLYTTDETEIGKLVGQGWKNEGAKLWGI